MIKKELLLGDEAIAWGALNAGLSGVYAYPGTPSTEITEFIQMHPLTRERGIHCNWSANEKTALEAALGMSFVGKRALVCMKHVGMNVCADAFVNSAMTGANGGLVVVAADDPSMHSSQNEQDSRFYAKFAMIPCFEPASQQEAYEMIGEAFDFSEKYQIPVLPWSKSANPASKTRSTTPSGPASGSSCRATRAYVTKPSSRRTNSSSRRPNIRATTATSTDRTNPWASSPAVWPTTILWRTSRKAAPSPC